MDEALLQTLPMAHRLALHYAPRHAWAATLGVLALDARLAGIIRADGEPVIARMKLAWWRERFAQDPQDWPKGEPLLALMRDASLDGELLSRMVDGWEMLLAEQLGARELQSFAEGRAAGWEAVSLATGCTNASDHVSRVGQSWALGDLALHLGAHGEAQIAREASSRNSARDIRLPRQLRPLFVLNGLVHRALKRDAPEVLDGPGAMLFAMRLGFAGR